MQIAKWSPLARGKENVCVSVSCFFFFFINTLLAKNKKTKIFLFTFDFLIADPCGERSSMLTTKNRTGGPDDGRTTII